MRPFVEARDHREKLRCRQIAVVVSFVVHWTRVDLHQSTSCEGIISYHPLSYGLPGVIHLVPNLFPRDCSRRSHHHFSCTMFLISTITAIDPGTHGLTRFMSESVDFVSERRSPHGVSGSLM